MTPRAGSRWLAFFHRLFRAITWTAPSSASELRSAGARTTFDAVCRSALRRGGVPALIHEGLHECVDLWLTILRCRWTNGRLVPMIDAGAWTRDLRLAIRALRTARVTTAIAVLTLALGIGINAAVFSVLDATLWHQVPFRDGPRLVEVANFSAVQKFTYGGMPRPLILEWRKQTDLFDRVEAYERQSFIYETDRGADMIAGAVVTPAMFDLLGVSAARGRTFSESDSRTGSSRIAVVSQSFWRERLGSTPDISGATLMLSGTHYRVVGVMPLSFRFPSGVEQVWTPYDLAQPPAEVPGPRTMNVFARIAPGVTTAQAAAAVSARGGRLSEAAGGPSEITGDLQQPGQVVDARTARSLWILSGAVALLFLIVCANVANLTLSRSLSRTRELATCAALGASPIDLVRVTALEQLLLASAGAFGGAAVAAGAIRLASASLPDAIRNGTLSVIQLDARVTLFMMAAGLIAAMIVGLPPALIAARTSVTSVLGQDNRTSTGSRAARRFRGFLAISEVAVSVVLLIGAALMTRSFVKLAMADQGFAPAGLVSMRIGLPAAGYRDAARRDRVAAEIATRIATSSDVEGVTSGGLPHQTSAVLYGGLEFDHSAGQATPAGVIPVDEVPPNFFSVLRIPLVAGRTFAADDIDGAVVANRRFAAKYFPQSTALGRRFRVGRGPWRTIVGIAGDTFIDRDGSRGEIVLYFPIGKASDALHPTMSASTMIDFRTLIVRTNRPDATIQQMTAAVNASDPSLVIWKIELVDHVLADAIARPRVVFTMMAIFAVAGLLLAMTGLYGVLSCLVAQRRQEIGLRLALGASRSQVRRLVLGNGMMLTSAGITVGLAAAMPLTQAMRALLYEVNPSDPVAIVGAVISLALTAGVACWWPARNAGRTDPLDLLRRH